MKLIIECERCGAKLELKPSPQYTFADLYDALIRSDMELTANIEDVIVGEDDQVGDTLDTELKSLEFRCKACGEYTTFDL